MALLRWLLVLVVLAYAGWLAWPFLSPFLEGASPDQATMRAGAEAAGGGDLFGIIPSAALWIGAVALYLVAAVLLGSGNPKAAVAYFLGFIADAVLRLALDRGGGDSLGRSTMAAPEMSGLPVEPLWLVLGALLLLGVLIMAVSRRRRRARTAGYLAA